MGRCLRLRALPSSKTPLSIVVPPAKVLIAIRSSVPVPFEGEAPSAGVRARAARSGLIGDGVRDLLGRPFRRRERDGLVALQEHARAERLTASGAQRASAAKTACDSPTGEPAALYGERSARHDENIAAGAKTAAAGAEDAAAAEPPLAARRSRAGRLRDRRRALPERAAHRRSRRRRRRR